MSIKDVAFVAVILGVLGILILAMLISLGYFVLYKRLMKGQKKLTLRRTALQMLLIACVFIVLGATLLLRTASGSGRTDLQPFSQYRSAWYCSEHSHVYSLRRFDSRSLSQIESGLEDNSDLPCGDAVD